MNKLKPTNKIDMAATVSEIIMKMAVVMQKPTLVLEEPSIAITHMEYDNEAALARNTSLNDVRSARPGR
ncbi:hypothetical protein INT43_008355 [Umbelopsis isabellina]|uniref:Uncharacterized protein n=1 Tax=Mortierella isabellina TaxID=91625 RepID=A0A8H7PCZ0_MORIS|nr:hypothetical protein INT43_008355 [Umbelopsis isabellina]